MPQTVVPLPALTFKGLDLRTSTLSRNFNSADLVSNIVKDSNKRFSTRRGFRTPFHQVQTAQLQALFDETYTYIDPDTNANAEEKIMLGMSMNGSYVNQGTVLYKLTPKTLTITYSGTGTGFISFVPDTTDRTKWSVTITDQTGTVLSQTYNYAFATSPQTLNTLRGLIDGLTNYSCTTIDAGGQSSPIDVFFPDYLDLNFTNGTTQDIEYFSLESIATLETADKVFTDANFVLPSFLNYANNLYIAYGKNLFKYDGHEAYRAGLPIATINAIADAAGGSTFSAGEVYIYKLVYSRVDNRGNIIEGEDSDDTLAVATHTMSGNKDIDLTVDNLIPGTYPNFNLRGAKINGAQTGVNQITVDSGHTLEIGDTVYFYDDDNNEYITREVTATTSTSITVDGATVGAADNAFISNNVRIQIWRTKNEGTDFYLIDEIPNDALNATQVYTDNTADTDVGEPFQEQLRKNSLPPACHFITSHQGLIVLAGDPDNPNRVSWNLPLAIEGFALESNSFDVRSGSGGLTGIASLDENTFVSFKESYHELKEGDFDDLVLRTLDTSTSNIGCTSFRTLQKIGDAGALTGLSLSGPFIFSGRTPELALSDSIAPLFDKQSTSQTNSTAIALEYFVLKRAIGFNDTLDRKYHLFLPAEEGTPAQAKTADPLASEWLVFDYDADIPYWTNYTSFNRYPFDDSQGAACGLINPLGGFSLFRKQLWFAGYYSHTANTIRAVVHHQKNNGNTYDYCDSTSQVRINLHYTPITREEGAVSVFLKPLLVNILRFGTTGLVQFFSYICRTYTVRTIHNFNRYERNTGSGSGVVVSKKDLVAVDTDASGAIGTIPEVSMKLIGAKARAVQICITNDDAGDSGSFENTVFDGVEFVYATPYDRIKHERQSANPSV